MVANPLITSTGVLDVTVVESGPPVPRVVLSMQMFVVALQSVMLVFDATTWGKAESAWTEPAAMAAFSLCTFATKLVLV